MFRGEKKNRTEPARDSCGSRRGRVCTCSLRGVYGYKSSREHEKLKQNTNCYCARIMPGTRTSILVCTGVVSDEIFFFFLIFRTTEFVVRSAQLASGLYDVRDVVIITRVKREINIKPIKRFVA